MTCEQKPVVGWIGLGAMGSGMAASLVSQGYKVKAYDVYPPSLKRVAEQGAISSSSPRDAAKGVQVLCLMVVNAQQVEETLFGKDVGVAEILENGASIIVFSTVPPSFLVKVAERLDKLGKNIGLVDSPVSGGSTRAAQGQLAIMSSGTPSSIATARSVLDSLTLPPQGGLTLVGERVGIASDFKMINQVFCAVSIAAQGEALGLAKALGLNVRTVYEIIKQTTGDSFMFGHRAPWSIRPDPTPKSAMTIINKDIAIVMGEARRDHFPAPLSAAAEQLYTAALAVGLEKEEDGLVSKFWEKLGGEPIAEQGTEEEEIEKARELVVKPGKKVRKVLLATRNADSRISSLKEVLKKAGMEVVEQGKDADAVIVSDRSAAAVEEVLANILSAGLSEGTPVILTSNVLPSSRLLQLAAEIKPLQLIDAPTAGGYKEAKGGSLTVFASGETDALSASHSVLSALSTQGGNATNLHFIGGGAGSATKVKAVNSLLEAIHLAVTGEGFAFAKHKKMDIERVFKVLSGGAARSFIMSDRFPRIISGASQDEPENTVSALWNDLSITLAEAKQHKCPFFLTQAAMQQLERLYGCGYADADDSSIIKLWEETGVKI
ncbi:hypothetical protein I308_105078 [Cryptococcus tetragattii IND107]|uniref:3-hydroxyisobutyrate dehydrogenase n=1 Tax=Cryptococcus tetragattii IND107 TaxID=1296105 RepID=A0ABR3BQC2_9TREE|nr:3-hydroxyisobutyrate dehydrogenase [Cryptococcus tetragattii IND107]